MQVLWQSYERQRGRKKLVWKNGCRQEGGNNTPLNRSLAWSATAQLSVALLVTDLRKIHNWPNEKKAANNWAGRIALLGLQWVLPAGHWPCEVHNWPNDKKAAHNWAGASLAGIATAQLSVACWSLTFVMYEQRKWPREPIQLWFKALDSPCHSGIYRFLPF